MSGRLKVAVMLQAGTDGTAAGTREQSRHAEQFGLDGIFVGANSRKSLQVGVAVKGRDRDG